MRLKEDNNMKEVEREEEEMMDSPTTISIGGGGLPQNMNVVVVGYALTSKKIKSFLQPKLEGLARYYYISFSLKSNFVLIITEYILMNSMCSFRLFISVFT